MAVSFAINTRKECGMATFVLCHVALHAFVLFIYFCLKTLW